MATAKYAIISSATPLSDLLDLDLNFGSITLHGQDIEYVGSSKADAVFLRPGVTIDFTAAGSGLDKLYLAGNFADYKFSLEGSSGVLERIVDGKLEKAIFSLGDALVFADGFLTTTAIINYLQSAATTPVPPVPDPVEKSSAPEVAAMQSATVRMSALAQSGVTFATGAVGVELVLLGSRGVDIVYIKAGTKVDTTGLGSGQDKIYFTGNYADYSKSLSGSLLTLERTVNGNLERVMLTAGDRAIFADGSVPTLDIKENLNAALPPNWDPQETTPGLSDIASISVDDAGGANNFYKANETITFSVTMKSPVTVTTTGGSPTLEVKVGDKTVQAVFDSANSTNSVLKFKYVVATGDADANGVSVPAGNATDSAIKLNGANINLTAGNQVAKLTQNPALKDSVNHKVDAAAPEMTATSITATDSSGAAKTDTLVKGDKIIVTLKASEVVFVSGSPKYTIEVDGKPKTATYVSGSGTDTLVFEYVVGKGDVDASAGITAPTDALKLPNNAAIKDAVGNDASLPVPAVVANANTIAVDALPPAITSASITGVDATGAAKVIGTAKASGTLKAGDKILVTVKVSEKVNVEGTPEYTIDVGGVSKKAKYVKGSGTDTLTFEYVVTSGDTDASGGITAAENALTLPAGAAIKDAVGNVADPAVPAVAANANAIGVDTTGPAIISSSMAALDSKGAPKAGPLGVGDKVMVIIKAGELLYVKGQPEYTIDVGGVAKKAQYVSGSGTDTLVFEYVVSKGDEDSAGGLTAGVGALTVGANASITDAGGNPAQLAVPVIAANANNIAVDAVAPVAGSGMVLSSVSSGSGDTVPDAVTNQSSGTIEFKYTGSDLAEGERFQYSYDGINWVDVKDIDKNAKIFGITDQLFQASPTISIRAIDAAGNVGPILISQTITYDTKAPGIPAISAFSLSDDSGVSATDLITKTAAQTVNVTFTGALAAGEKLFGSFDGGTTFVDLSSFITTSGNTTTLTWTGVTLSAGKGSIQFKVRNAVGNESTVFSKQYTLDTSADNSLSFTGLNSNATVQENQVVQGKGAEAGAKVELLSDGAVISTTTADADGFFNFILPSQTVGTHQLTLRYTDSAGNISTPSAQPTTVTWDSVKAKVAPLAPAGIALSADTDSGSSHTDGITNVANAKLSGKSAVPGATIEVSLVTANGYRSFTQTVTVAADGTWSYTLSGADALSADASFVVRQQSDGVWSPYSSQYHVKFDNTVAAPTLVLKSEYDTGDSNSDGITKLDTYTLNGAAEAGATVEVFDNGNKIATAVADSNGKWQVTLSNLTSAKHNYTAHQIDLAGNVSAKTAALPITVDRGAAKLAVPLLDIASNTGSTTDNTTAVKRPILYGSNAEAGARIRVFDGATEIGSALVASDGSWSFAGYAGDLSLGEHSFTVTQTDVAGNVSVASDVLKLTIVAPVTLVAPSAPALAASSDSGTSNSDGITNATSLVFSGTGAVAGGKIEVWQGQVKLGEVSTAAAGAWSITLTNIAEGADKKLTARVVDNLGNTSAFSPETSITVDRTGTSNALTLNPLSATDDTGRLNTDSITKTTNPVISGSGAHANAKVNIYNGDVLLATLTADASGRFSGQVTLAANATHTLTAVETNVDAAGNSGARSAGLSVTVDTIAAVPVITTSKSELNAFKGNPTIQGKGEAGALIELYEGSAVVASAYVRADGSWSIQYPQTALGEHPLSVRQTDIAGNVSAISEPVVASINAGTPAVLVTPTLQAPAFKYGEDTGVSATDGITQKASPVLIINGVDSTITAANVNTSLKVYDGTTQITGTFAKGVAAGSWEFTPGTPLSNGKHDINVKQTVNGAESFASNSLAVTVDTTVNAPEITPPLYARYVLLKQNGAAANFLYLNEVEVYANGVNVALNKTVTAKLTGNDVYNGYPASGITDGSLNTDNNGGYAANKATTDNWIMIDLGGAYLIDQIKLFALSAEPINIQRAANLDVFVSANPLSGLDYTQLTAGEGGAVKMGTTGPSPSYTTTLTPPAGNNTPTLYAQPLLNGKGEAGSTIELFDGATSLGMTKVRADGTWSFQASGLNTGNHSITVKQVDLAGNISSTSAAYSFTLTLATAAPVVPAAPVLATASDSGSIATDKITNLSKVTLQGSGVANETIEIYRDNGAAGYQLLGSAMVSTTGTWSLTGVVLSTNAINNIVVRAKNAAGTSDYSAALKVVHDSIAPSAATVGLLAASDSGVAGDNRTNKSAVGEVSLTGTAEAGASITIKRGTTVIGTATADANGNWTAVLTQPLTANAVNNLTVTATDIAGNVSTATNYSVTHDNEAPTSNLTLTSGTRYSGMPTLSGSGCETGAYVDIYDGTRLLASAQADSAGNWSVQLTSLTDSGNYSIKAVQRDAAGNVSATPASFNIIVDANMPTGSNPAPVLTNVSVLAADDNGSSTSDGVTTIRQARLTGTGALKNAIIKIWEGNTLIGTTVADATGAWTFTAAKDWSVGSHALSVSQESAGTSASPGFNYTLSIVDVLAAPVITSIAGDTSNAAISAAEVAGGTATVTGTGFKGATVTITFTNSNGIVITKTATVNDNGWTSPGLTAADIATLGIGSITVQAKQTLGGFTSSFTSTQAATIDAASFTPPPTPVTINANIATDDVINASERPAISGTATAGASVQVTLTNTVTNARITLAVVTANASTGAWTTAALTAQQVSTLGGDSQPLRVDVVQTTSSGQLSTVSRNITIDTVAPTNLATITLASASDSGVTGDNITNATKPTLQGSADANSSVNVYRDGTTLVGQAKADASGHWSLPVPAALADGNYSFTAKQLDAAGNESAASKATAVTVDTAVTRPEFIKAVPAVIKPTTARYVLVKQNGAASATMLVNEVEVYANGVNVALNKTVTAKLTGNDVYNGYPASGVTNGSLARDNNNGYAANRATSDNWIMVDLGADFPIDQIKLFALSSSSSDIQNAANIDIFVSANPLSGLNYDQLTAGEGGAVRIGTTGPSPSYTTTLTPPQNPALNPNPLLNGTGEPGSTIELFEGGASLGLTKVRADGTWSFQTSDMTTGSHSITIKQTDVAGNESKFSSAYTFTIDASKLSSPVLDAASDSGDKRDGVTNITTPTLKGSGAAANAKIAIFDGVIKLGQVTADANGVWTFTVPATLALAAGAHTLVAKQLTEDGGTLVQTSDPFTLLIDTTVSAPVVNTIATLVNAAPVVTGTAEANATITLVATSTDGVTKTFTTTANASGVWSINTGAGSDPLVANKVYSVNASQVDAAGNSSAQSMTYTVNYDTDVLAPVVNAISGTQASTFTVTGSGEAGATVRVFDGQALLGTTTVNAQGQWSLVVQGLSNGAHTLNVEQRDLAGNLSTPTSTSVTVDASLLSAPVLAGASDSGVKGDGLTNVTSPGLSGVAAAKATVEVWDTFNGSSIKLGTATADSKGNWSLTLTGQADGMHSYVTKEIAADGSVSRTSTELSLTIDTIAPAVAPTMWLTTDSDSGANKMDGITNVAQPTLSGKADVNAVVNVYRGDASIGLMLLGSAKADDNGNWSFKVPVILWYGKTNFYATQADAAGNEAYSSAVTVTVDTAVTTPEFIKTVPAVMKPVTARYVLLKQNGAASATMLVNEVEVYANGVNVALNKTVTAKLTGNDVYNGYPASGVTNGNLARDNNNGYAASKATTDNWIMVDLGADFPIDQIKLFALSNSTSDIQKAANIDIFVSTNPLSGLNYDQLTAGESGAVRMGTTGPSPTYTTTLTPPPQDAALNPNPLLNGTGEPGSTIELFEGATSLGLTKVRADGTWSFQTSDMTTGGHSITAKQTDLAGNESAVSRAYTFTIDASKLSPPVLDAASDSGDKRDGVTNITTPTLKGSGAAANAKIAIFDGNSKLGMVTADANGLWTFTVPASLVAGAHTLVAKQLTADGGTVVQTSGPFTLQIDTTVSAPVVNDIARHMNTAPVVTGTAEANATITLVATSTDGVTKTFTTTANASGVWSINTGAGSDPLVANKVYSVRVSQVDAAGNSSVSSMPLPLNYDTVAQPPVVNALSGTQAATFTVIGSGEAGATVRVFDGKVLLGSATVDAQGQWSLVVQGLSDGAHTLYAEQRDLAGNLSSQTSTSVTVDASLLSAPVLAGASDSGVKGDGLTNVSSPGLSGVAAAKAKVEVWDTFNGSSIKLGTVTADSKGNWSLTLTGQADGKHSYVSKEIAADGSVSRTSTELTLTIDTIAPAAAPTMSLTTDSGNTTDGITNVAKPTLSGKADANAVVNVYQGDTYLGNIKADANGNWSFQVPADLWDGVTTFTARQLDTAGNESAGRVVTVTVDTAVTTPVIIRPTTARYVLLKQSGASGIMLVNEVEVYVNGVNVALNKTVTAGLTGSDTYNGYPASGVTNGNLTRDNNNGYAANRATTDNWIMVDLGADYPVDEIKVFALSNSTSDIQNAANLDIFVSANPLSGLNYDQLTAGEGGAVKMGTTGPSPSYTTTLTPPVGNNTSALNPNPLLNGKGEPGSTIELFDGATSLGLTKVRADGTWSYQTSGMTTGSHSITVKQTDVAGNESAVSSAYTFTIDASKLSPPVLDAGSDSGVKGDGVTNVATPTLKGSGAAANAKIDIFDGAIKLGQVTADANGQWTFTVPASQSLVAGVHSIVAKQLPEDGGTVVKTSSTLVLQIDASVSAPVVDTIATLVNAAPVVTGTAEANATITLVATSTDGVTKTFTTTANASGVWSINTGVGSDPLVANKVYSVNASQVDAAGNSSAQSMTYTVNYDTVALAPVLNAITGIQAATFTVTGSGEAGATVYVFDGKVYLGSARVNEQGQWSFVVQGLSEGPHTLYAEQRDLAGNLSSQTSSSVTVSASVLSAPVLAVASDSGVKGDGITNVSSPSLSGVAAANAKVEVWDTFNGSSIKVGTVTADSKGNWSLTLTGQADGKHSYVSKEIAADGTISRSSTTALSLTIDTIAPAVAPTMWLTTDSDSGANKTDGITNVTKPSFSGKAEANAVVNVYQGDGIIGLTLIGTTKADANGNWSFQAPAILWDGKASFYATQADAAGNEAYSSAVTVTVDTVVTTPVITRPTTARYVLLKQNGASATMLVNEVEVYVNGVNVALNKTVTAMLTGNDTYNGYPASGVTNGNLARDNNNGYAANRATTDNWIMVDLGADYPVDEIKVFALSNSTSDIQNAANIDIFVSANPLSGLTLAQLTAGESGAVKMGTTGPSPSYTTTLTLPVGNNNTSALNPNPLLNGKGEVGSTIELFEGATSLGMTKVRADGTWSYQTSGLTTGSHSITIQQTDVAGNKSAVSPAYTFTIDASKLSPPVLDAASDSGDKGDRVTNIATPILKGSGAAANAKIDIFDGSIRLGQVTADANGLWTFTVPANLALASGAHSLVAKQLAEDGVVVKTSSSFTLQIDITASAPVVNPIAPNVNAAPVVTGTAEANATITLVATSADGTKTFTTTANASGVWSINTGAGSNPLEANKVYSVRVSQVDAAGNSSALSVAQTLNYDTVAQAPVVNALSGTQATTFTVTGSGEAGANVRVFDGQVLLGITTVNVQGQWSFVVQGLSDGAHTLNVEQRDLAGNLSLQTSSSVTVSTSVLSAPVLALASDSGVDWDGITNVTSPTLKGSGALANARLQVFEGDRLLGETVADSSGNWSLGLSSRLSEGTHSLQVKELASDGVSVARTSAVGTITIDTTAPAVLAAPTLDVAGDSGVSASDGVTRLKNQVLRGKAEPFATVELLDNGRVIGTAVANSAGDWSIAVTLNAGSHKLTSRQSDAARNVSPVSDPTTLVVDDTAAAPTLNLSATAVGHKPIVTGLAEAFAMVTIRYEGGKVEVQADAAGNWRAQLPFAPNAQTTYALTVTQTDIAGNISSASSGSLVVTPTVAATPTAPATLSVPVMASGQDSGKSASDHISNNNHPVFNGQGAVANAIVELWANGRKVASTTAGADGKYSFAASSYSILLQEGLHNLTVRQVVNGVSSQDSPTVKWTVDTIASFTVPQLQVAAEFATDAQGVMYTNTNKPTIGGITEAGAEVKVYDNGVLWQTVTADATGRWSVTATLSNATSHTITTQVTDIAGNVSASSPAIEFTVLSTPPAAPVAHLLAGGDSGKSATDGITNITNQWVTGTVAVTQGVAAPLVQIFDNGVLIGSVQPNAVGAWTFNITNLSNGGHVISVRALDAAGNLSSSQNVAVLTIDTAAPGALPAVTLSSDQDTGVSQTDGLTNKARPELKGKAEPGSALELYVDGVLVAAEVSIDAQGTFSIKPVQALSEGAHQLSLVQVDMAGNRSPLSPAKSIIIDTVIKAPGDLTLVAADVVYYNAGTPVTGKLRPTLKGYGEAGATVEIFNGSVSLGTTTVNGDGSWSLQLSTDLSATNSLYAVQTDIAGNRSTNSPTLSVSYVAGAVVPSISLQVASDTGTLGDGVTANTRPVLVGAGAQAGDTIELFNGNTKVGTAVADSAGGWAVQPSLALLDGTYTLTVKNASQSNASLGELQLKILATPGAVLTNLTLAASADTGIVGDNVTSMVSPVIEGSGAAPGALIRLLEGTRVVGQGLADASGAWSIKTIALSDGLHELVAVQVNAAGVVSPVSPSLALTIDSGAPAKLAAPKLNVADDSGTVGDGVTNHNAVSVSGTAESGAIVNLYNGTQLLMSVRAQLDGRWSARLENLVQGNYSLSATQTDVAGNVSAMGDALSLVVDLIAAAPTIALSATQRQSRTDPNFTTSTLPTFVGKAEAGAIVKVYDGDLLLGTAIANASGDWSVTSGSQLSVGTHGNIYAVQTDVAGNQSDVSTNLALTIVPSASVKRTYDLTWNVAGALLSFSMADINGDGNLDLIVPPTKGLTRDMIALGDGTGAFTQTSSNTSFSSGMYTGGFSRYLDLNGDGYTDVLALANVWSAGLDQSTQTGYWINRGAINRMANVATAADAYLPTTSNNGSYGENKLIDLGDLNGDGHLDFLYSYGYNGTVRTGVMLSTGSGIWRSLRDEDVLGAAYVDHTISSSEIRMIDINNDGLLDMIVVRGDITTYLNTGKGYVKNQVLTEVDSYAFYDANHDGYIDMVGSKFTQFGGEAGFKAGNFGGAPSSALDIADINGDGKLDYISRNQNGEISVMLYVADGVYKDVAALFDWRRVGGSIPDSIGAIDGHTVWKLEDINNDRALDLIVLGDKGEAAAYGGIALNPTLVAENTYLQVMVSNDHGGKNSYGAVVKIYDSKGNLVDSKLVERISNSAVSFYGLNPNETYDVVVIYPGNEKSVTVVTGKAGLGVDKINPAALKQIVDSSLSSVSPGGKDVIWVAKEDRSVSTNGGVWLGTGLADQMVGDKGDDVFMPNGARAGEAGDTLTGGGGHDRFVFNVKANLNTAATITDFGAEVGAESDSIDLGQLLTLLGYTGDRTVSALSAWLRIYSNGTDTTLQVDAHSGTNGAASGFTDLVTLNGVQGKSLDYLVSNGFVHLGGMNLGGIAADQTVTETASRAGVNLAAMAALTAEGSKFAAGFNGGKLLVTLQHATGNDSLSFASVNNVSYNASTGDVMINGVKVAKVDAGMNGIGAGGKLLLNFDFSAAGASYASAEQQAGAVEAILKSLLLTSNTYAPLALDREITFKLIDALGAVTEVKSGLRITPEADSGTYTNVNYVTGTEAVETLIGTTANETFVGYNGQPTKTNTANLDTAKTFGDTLTGGGGKDTFKWLKLQLMNSDAGDKITDFGLKVGTGVGQGAAEADVIDVSELLVGYNASSNLSDFVRAVNVNGKVQIQIDHDGKANGSGFDKSWFVTLDNLGVDVNNQVVANTNTMTTTVAGLTGNVTLDNLIQQMMADNQFKVLP